VGKLHGFNFDSAHSQRAVWLRHWKEALLLACSDRDRRCAGASRRSRLAVARVRPLPGIFTIVACLVANYTRRKMLIEFVCVGYLIEIAYISPDLDPGVCDLAPTSMRLQISKVDAAQHLGPRDRLRVVHGGRDQVVDIDVVELEHLEHVGATRMQDLGDLRPIPLAVELGLHGVGGVVTWLSASAVANNLTRSVSMALPR
jgi:hypothetical protein